MSLADWLGWPAALPSLVLVPMLAALLHAVDRRRKRTLAMIVGRRVDELAAERSERRRMLRRRLSAFGLLFGLLAVLQPLWGVDQRRIEQRGVDVVVCLDVSRSMLARDLRPSRLGRAQQAIRALAERTRGDRLGLVVFAGEARLAVPMTRDTASFAELAETADPLSVRVGGTDLGTALDIARAALSDETEDPAPTPGAILLLTDGEDPNGLGRAAAELCRQRGIAVHCVGFGSALGSKITVVDDNGEESFLRTRGGDEVITTMDSANLRAIAAAAGGTFVDAGTRREPLVDIYQRQILPMARKVFADEARERRQNHYQVPLLVGFVLLLLELGLSERRRRR